MLFARQYIPGGILIDNPSNGIVVNFNPCGPQALQISGKNFINKSPWENIRQYLFVCTRLSKSALSRRKYPAAAR